MWEPYFFLQQHFLLNMYMLISRVKKMKKINLNSRDW